VGYAEETMRLKWVCAVLLGVTSAAAQESTGSITGKVDALDLYTPNATVTILSPVQIETNADSDGAFFIPNLAPGTYKLRIHAVGFFGKDSELRVATGAETSAGRVVLEVKVPPCVGHPRRPRLSEKTAD
jgi:Carboxypeptidase regulatory-like domain